MPGVAGARPRGYAYIHMYAAIKIHTQNGTQTETIPPKTKHRINQMKRTGKFSIIYSTT